MRLGSVLRRRSVRIGLAAGLPGLALCWLAAASLAGPDLDWERVERDDLILGVEVEGTLRAVDTSSLGPPQVPWIWEYKISMLAPEGEEVSEGRPVLAFDATELQRRLQEEKAESEAAQKELEKKEAELALGRRQDRLRLEEARGRSRKARLKVDVPPELSSESALEAARLDLELADKEIAYLERKLEASVRSGDAALAALRNQKARADRKVREMQDAIEAMTVKAPRDGTVVYTTNWRDEKKKVGDSCWRGETVLEIPDLTRMKGEGEVDEADAARVKVGQRLTLRLDAHPDEELVGTVSEIWDTVQQKSWRNPVKVVKLEIELEETDTRRMRPGMRFRGRVETEKLEGVVVVPAASVFLSDNGPVVYRKTLFGYERVGVQLGRRNEEKVQVVEGLDEGDRVSRTDPGEEAA